MDIYHELLGIPPDEQPPNHYRLLGVAIFESNEVVIINATRRQCAFVRTVALVHPKESQNLLNELTAAKLCLLNKEQREVYDAKLRASLLGDTKKKATTYFAPAAKAAAMFNNGHDHESARLESEGLASSRKATFYKQMSSDAFVLAGQSWEIPTDDPTEALKEDAEWIIGNGLDVSIRVRAPWVSRQHCRVTRRNGQMFVEDLGSRNGTFVNGVPVKSVIPVREDDVLTLGRKTRVPWPLPEKCQGLDVRIFSIGRAPDNDYVIRDKSVSKHHAQLILQGAIATLQDLDSRNGTRVGLFENRIQRCELDRHLSVYFGGTKVFAKELIDSVTNLNDQPH